MSLNGDHHDSVAHQGHSSQQQLQQQHQQQQQQQQHHNLQMSRGNNDAGPHNVPMNSHGNFSQSINVNINGSHGLHNLNGNNSGQNNHHLHHHQHHNNHHHSAGSSDTSSNNGSSIELPTLSPLSPADLNGFVSHLDEDDHEDLLKQLGETSFELDAILDEFVDENNPHHPQHQFGSFVSGQEQHQANQHGGNNNNMHNTNNGMTHGHHLHPGHMNMSNSNGLSNGLLKHVQLDERSSLLNKRRKKSIKCEMNLNESSHHHVTNPNLSMSNNNNGQRKQQQQQQSMQGSILQNQLCQPHHSPDGMGCLNKATIASANPLLAGAVNFPR